MGIYARVRKRLFASIPGSVSRAVSIHRTLAVLSIALASIPAMPDSSEYSQPSFDPGHGGAYTMPNERIDTFTGGLNIIEKDIVLPGPGGFDLEIVRWYSSKINQWDPDCLSVQREVTPVGAGWQIHMGRLWDNPQTNDPVPAFKLELPGGGQQPFYHNDLLGVPNADYVSPGGWSLREGSCIGAEGICRIATSPAGIEYHFPESTSYRMDPDNSYLYVATIRDPVGNRITVDYDFGCNCNQAYITTVTDAWGRQVQFHYTDGSEGEKSCTLDGSACQSEGDCPDRCSGAESEPCTWDSDCSEGTCSDDDSSCRADLDCDRNCSNDPSVACSHDSDCGTRHCVGGSDSGEPCSHDSDCLDVCEGGERPGESCSSDSQCGATCDGGEYPGEPCNRDSDCGAICDGGRNPGDHCSIDPNCGAICEGGFYPGDSCSEDSDCGGICEGGFYPGDSCSEDYQCGSACDVGPDAGDSCGSDGQCRNVCSNNSMKLCSRDFDCPGGTCLISTCVSGTCSAGTCDKGTCSHGSCIEGTCNIGTCPPGPTCDPQPSCDNPGECLENHCEPGATGQRYLDKITVAWVSGTATYDYTVDEGSWIDSVLTSVTVPAGLTTSYDYTVGSTEQSHDIEIKKITFPTGGTVEYTYADHEFFYPLQNSSRDMECTRVVTSKKLGSGTWTFDFPSGRADDRTTIVTDPAGDRREYTYFRYSDTGPDRIWKAGLLEKLKIAGDDGILAEDTYTYEPKQISHDNVSHKSGYTEPAQIGLTTEKRTTLHETRTSRVTWGGYDDYGNPSWMEEFGWDGALYRRTEYEYAHTSGTFANAHIVDRRTRITVEDAGGAKCAETINVYDADNMSGNAFGNLDHSDQWTGSDYVRTRFEYDGDGDRKLIEISGGGANRTTNLVYYRGMLKKVVKGGRTLFDRTIDPNSSLITAQTNANGGTTHFGYDNWSRVTSIDPPGADPTTIIDYGKAKVTVTRGPAESVYSYDPFGRLEVSRTKIDSSSFSYNVVHYDARGDVLRQYEPSHSADPPVWTTFGRDALGRVTSADGPDGNTTFTYAADQATINDGTGTRTITHDAFGRTIQVREGNYTTNYEYDILDNLVRVDGPGSAADRVFEWNAAGWLVSENHPETGLIQYGTNGIGDRVWQQDADGDRENYTYDAEGRRIGIDRPGSDNDVHYYYDGDPVPGHSASYQNASGKLTGMTDATGSTVWPSWDINGRVLEIEQKRGAEYYGTSISYDSQGNVERIDYPHLGAASRSEVTYAYNAAGLVIGVSLNGQPLVDDVHYNPLLTPDLWQYTNGVTVHVPTAESERNRPTEIYTEGATKAGSDGDIHLSYSYNGRGQVSAIDFGGRSDTYTYESARSFLTSVSYGGSTIDYYFDADGNMTDRVSAAFPQLEFSRSHSGNRISGCSYSASGNLLDCEGHEYGYTTNNKVRTADGVAQFTYDGMDRLSETLVFGDDRVLADFHAAPFGRLSRFTGPAGGILAPGEDWIYAAGQLVATVRHGAGEQVGDTLRLHKSGGDIDLTWSDPDQCSHAYDVRRSTDPSFSSYETLADDLTQPSFTDGGAAQNSLDYFYLTDSVSKARVRWYVADHRGSTLLVLDDTGEVLANYEYFPFGELKSGSSCTDLEGVYQGALRDPYSDLYDLGVRHHSPGFARFLVPDLLWPDLELPGRWNRYLYAANDPVNMIDVLGYWASTKHGGINPLRNIDVYDDPRGFWQNTIDISVNFAGGFVSDFLGMDDIIDGTVVAGDSTNSTGARIWGGTKAVFITISDAAGGVAIKRTLGRAFKSLFAKTEGAIVTAAAEEVASDAAARGGARVTGDALKAARSEFNKVRPKFWKNEAATNAGKYGADDLARMRQGKPPIGSDGFPMELHHRTPLSEGGSNAFDNLSPMTRTDHRLGSNLGRNHPNR